MQLSAAGGDVEDPNLAASCTEKLNSPPVVPASSPSGNVSRRSPTCDSTGNSDELTHILDVLDTRSKRRLTVLGSGLGLVSCVIGALMLILS